MASVTRASEELLAAPLPDLIRELGLAVAEANRALVQESAGHLGSPAPAGHEVVFAINSAEIEVNVAISIQKQTEASAGGGFKLGAFSVNASYKSTFGFKEDASSKIKIQLSAKPRGES